MLWGVIISPFYITSVGIPKLRDWISDILSEIVKRLGIRFINIMFEHFIYIYVCPCVYVCLCTTMMQMKCCNGFQCKFIQRWLDVW